MPVTFMIPGPLRPLAGGRALVRVAAAHRPLSEALAVLWRECPAVRDRVLTEQGEVRPHINIFVDGESARDLDGLATPVREGAEIFILPAVSGG
jgi:molybdopterin converting factor small subunit